MPDAPDDVAAIEARARELWHGGERDAARAMLLQAARQGDALAEDRLLTALTALLIAERDGFAEARAIIDGILARGGAPCRGLLRHAARNRVLLSDERKARIWDLLREHDPADTEAQRGRLQAALRLRETHQVAALAEGLEAAEAAEAAVSPREPGAAMLLGSAFLLVGRQASARSVFEKARIDWPRHPSPLVGLAAACLDEGATEAASQLMAEAASLYHAKLSLQSATLVRHAARRWPVPPPPPRTPAARTCEVFLFTHCQGAEKLRENGHLGAPGTGLIAGTLLSLRDALRVGAQTPVTVMYDHRPTPQNDLYLEALKVFCTAHGVTLVVNHGVGLRGQWLAASRMARAALLLMVEHDHEFLPSCPTLEEMKAVFARRPDVQHLKLSRRPLIVKGFDSLLTQSRRDQESGITGVPAFSNIPHMMRRSYLEEVVVPVVSDNTAFLGRNGGAAGVEEAMNVCYRAVEADLGLCVAMRLFGTYSWGAPGGPQRVMHLGV